MDRNTIRRRSRSLATLLCILLVALSILFLGTSSASANDSDKEKGGVGREKRSFGRLRRETLFSLAADDAREEHEAREAHEDSHNHELHESRSDGIAVTVAAAPSSEEKTVVVPVKTSASVKKPDGQLENKEKEARIIIVKGPLKRMLDKKNQSAFNHAIKKQGNATAEHDKSHSKSVVATTVEKGADKARKVTTTKVSKDTERADKPVMIESVTEESNSKGQPSRVTVSKMKITPSKKMMMSTTVAPKVVASRQFVATTTINGTHDNSTHHSSGSEKIVVVSTAAPVVTVALKSTTSSNSSVSTYKTLCEQLPEPIKAFCLLIPSVVAKNVDQAMAVAHAKAAAVHHEASINAQHEAIAHEEAAKHEAAHMEKVESMINVAPSAGSEKKILVPVGVSSTQLVEKKVNGVPVSSTLTSTSASGNETKKMIAALSASEKKPVTTTVIVSKPAESVSSKKLAAAASAMGVAKVAAEKSQAAKVDAQIKADAAAKADAVAKSAKADAIASIDSSSRSDALALADDNGVEATVDSQTDSSVIETEAGAEVSAESRSVDLSTFDSSSSSSESSEYSSSSSSSSSFSFESRADAEAEAEAEASSRRRKRRHVDENEVELENRSEVEVEVEAGERSAAAAAASGGEQEVVLLSSDSAVASAAADDAAMAVAEVGGSYESAAAAAAAAAAASRSDSSAMSASDNSTEVEKQGATTSEVSSNVIPKSLSDSLVALLEREEPALKVAKANSSSHSEPASSKKIIIEKTSPSKKESIVEKVGTHTVSAEKIERPSVIIETLNTTDEKPTTSEEKVVVLAEHAAEHSDEHLVEHSDETGVEKTHEPSEEKVVEKVTEHHTSELSPAKSVVKVVEKKVAAHPEVVKKVSVTVKPSESGHSMVEKAAEKASEKVEKAVHAADKDVHHPTTSAPSAVKLVTVVKSHNASSTKAPVVEQLVESVEEVTVAPTVKVVVTGKPAAKLIDTHKQRTQAPIKVARVVAPSEKVKSLPKVVSTTSKPQEVVAVEVVDEDTVGELVEVTTTTKPIPTSSTAHPVVVPLKLKKTKATMRGPSVKPTVKVIVPKETKESNQKVVSEKSMTSVRPSSSPKTARPATKSLASMKNVPGLSLSTISPNKRSSLRSGLVSSTSAPDESSGSRFDFSYNQGFGGSLKESRSDLENGDGESGSSRKGRHSRGRGRSVRIGSISTTASPTTTSTTSAAPTQVEIVEESTEQPSNSSRISFNSSPLEVALESSIRGKEKAKEKEKEKKKSSSKIDNSRRLLSKQSASSDITAAEQEESVDDDDDDDYDDYDDYDYE